MVITQLILALATCSATARVSIEPSMELLRACPGRSVSLNCSVESLQASFFWSVWCECRAGSSGSCRDTCSSMESTLSSTRDRHNTGSVCASTGNSPVITYSNNFTTIVDQNGNMFVPFSALTIAVPIEFQQLNTRLCLTCEGELGRYLLVPGLPSHPRNLLFYPQYTTATDTEVIVNFVWSPEPELSAQDDNIEYLIIFLDDTDSFNSSYRTTVPNLTVALEFNKIYSIMIYTSRCDGALTSVHPLSRNISIDRDSSCSLPRTHPNVDVNIIVPGSLLSFQCREGLVPVERLEAVCGPEGIWSPDPTLHICMNSQEDTTLLASTTRPTQPDQNCETSAFLITTTVVSVITLLFISVGTFTVGLLVGRHTAKLKAVGTTICAAQSEPVASPAISHFEPATGVELKRVHEYEDIVLHETPDHVNSFTTNVAYGFSLP